MYIFTAVYITPVYITPVCVYITAVYIVAVYITAVYITPVCITPVYITAVYITAVYIATVYITGVYFTPVCIIIIFCLDRMREVSPSQTRSPPAGSAGGFSEEKSRRSRADMCQPLQVNMTSYQKTQAILIQIRPSVLCSLYD